MEVILAILFAIFLQIIGAFFLVYYAYQYSKDKVFSSGQSTFLLFSLAIIPIIMFLLSSIFSAEYSSQKGDHWFYYIHDELAGLILVPVYLAASMSIITSLYDEEYLATSSANFIMVATLAAIAVWYTYATLALRLAFDLRILAIVPAITGFNYLMFLIIIGKKRQLQPPNLLFVFVWFSALIASLLAKYPLAKNIYEKLPKEMPSYDCFIVSAAAQGHPWLVQSWINPVIGKPVNHQLYRFKRFEVMLAFYFPTIHRVLRRIYNHISPSIAKRIRYPWQADLVYLLIKPIEWVVFLVLIVLVSRVKNEDKPKPYPKKAT